MKVIRGDASKTYWKKIPVSLIRDQRLSYEARGVAAHLISMSERWNFVATKLPNVLKDRTRESGRFGRDLTQRIIKEFVDNGYLIRSKFRNESGRWVWETVFNPLAGVDFMTDEIKLVDESDESTWAGEAVDGVSSTVSAVIGAVADDGLGSNSNLNEVFIKEVFTNEAFINEETLHSADVEGQSTKKCSSDLTIDLSHPLMRNYLKVFGIVSEKFSGHIACEFHQQVADEFVGAISASRHGNHLEIKSARGWLVAVFKAVERGEFVPEFGVVIKNNREKERKLIENRPLESEIRSDKCFDYKSERASEAAIADSLKILKNRS